MKTLLLVVMTVFSVSLGFSQEKEEQAIRQVVETMIEGWNTGSGEQFASVFTDDHDFIVWNGYYFTGMNQVQNAASHQQLFDTMYKDTKNHAVVDNIRFIREDLALIHILAAVTPKDDARPKDPQVLISAILEKQSSGWKMLSFHNLDLEVFQNEDMKKASPIPVEQMYARWYAVK